MKRRSLVLTDETARHPFRASLPPYVRRDGEAVVVQRGSRAFNRGDVSVFFGAYFAVLAAALVFIA